MIHTKTICKDAEIIYVEKTRRTNPVKRENKNPLSKTVKAALDATLRMSANSTACCVVHQPKAPKKLEAFKKIK